MNAVMSDEREHHILKSCRQSTVPVLNGCCLAEKKSN